MVGESQNRQMNEANLDLAVVRDGIKGKRWHRMQESQNW
jgi:hypothetical protein